MNVLKIYTVEFAPIWPVPFGLVIAAENQEAAEAIARDTLTHCTVWKVSEVDLSGGARVIFYEAGDY